MAQYYVARPLRWYEQVILMLISVGGAAIVHYGVERPLRLGRSNTDERSTGLILACIVVATAILVALGTAAYSGKVPSYGGMRVKSLSRDDVARLRKASWREVRARRDIEFQSGSDSIVIIGDSSAKDMFNALLSQRGISLIPTVQMQRLPIMTECQALFSHQYSSTGLNQQQQESCARHIVAVQEHDQLSMANVVIVAMRWHTVGVDGLPKFLESLRQRTTAPIIVMMGRPSFMDVPSLVARGDARMIEHRLAMSRMDELRMSIDRISHLAG